MITYIPKKELENPEKVNNAFFKRLSSKKSPQRLRKAAIHVSEEYKPQANIAHQVETCRKFLCSQGLIFSGDLFLEKKGSKSINKLVQARFLSQRYDCIVGYVSCRDKFDTCFIGLVMCWDVKNFLLISDRIVVEK
jgi:hypothetical protein